MAGELEVSVLGAVRARRDGDDLPLGGRRQRAVLARLAIAGGRAVDVDRLIDELWDGEPPASALNTLQSYVSNLRRVLGAEVIVRTGDGYRVGGVDLVAAAFEQAVAAVTAADVAPADRVAGLDAALALWHGAALGDLADEPWAVGDAVRLTELRLAALEARFDAALALGHHALVAPELDALAQEHPLRERITAQLVLALYRCGRQADALRAHERLRSHLAEELGLDPSPELARLAAQVLDHDPALAWSAPAAPAAVATPEGTTPVAFGDLVIPLPPAVEERRSRSAFVGRSTELDELHRQWAEVEAGGRSLVLVEGEPGAGKTRLAQQLARHVHERGGNVLWGRCTAENLLAYQPIAEALRTGSRALPAEQAAAVARSRPAIATLLPDVAGADRPAERAERWDLFEAVVDMFGEGSTSVAALVVVDDLHWADASTIALLDHLVRRGRSARVLVLATARRPAGRPTAALDQLVVDLRGDGRLATVAVGGIGTDDVVALLDERGVAVTRAEADDLRVRTGGNPFFLEALVEHGPVEATGDVRAVPASVRDLLDERLHALGDQALHVLSAAAVIGPRVDLSILGPVVGLDTDALLDVVDAAVASRLLVEDEELGWVSFPHALVRSALVARTTRNREARHHLRTAEVVEARPSALDREATVAQHLLAAGRLAPAVRTADACVAAGRCALSGIADEDGLAWAERAVAALDATGSPDDEDARRARVTALLLQVESSRLIGDAARASVALEQAKVLAGGDLDPDLLLEVACEAALFVAANDYPWALEPFDPQVMGLLERALVEVDPADRVRRPVLLAWACTAATGSVDNDKALAWSAQALDTSAADADPTARAQVVMNARMPLATPLHLDERFALHVDMLRPGVRDFGMHLSARGFASITHLEAGRHAEAEALRAEHRAIADAHDRPWYSAYAVFLDGAHAFLEGEVERAEAMYRLGTEMGEPGHTGVRSQFEIGAELMSARARGREADLRDLADRIIAARPDRVVGWAMRARSALGAGDVAGARDVVEAIDRDDLAAAGDDLLGYVVVDLVAEVAWLLGDASLGAVVADTIAPFAHQVGVIGQGAVITGTMHHPHGLALAAAGRLDEASAALQRAVASGSGLGWRPTMARASAARAEVLDLLGDADGAATCRGVAEAVFADLAIAALPALGSAR